MLVIKDLAKYFHNYEEMSQYRYIFLKYSVCLTPRYLFFKIMNLLASFTLGGFNPYAAAVGVLSLVLFALVGLVAGPNLSKFDKDA